MDGGRNRAMGRSVLSAERGTPSVLGVVVGVGGGIHAHNMQRHSSQQVSQTQDSQSFPWCLQDQREQGWAPKHRALQSLGVGGAFCVPVQPRWWRSTAASRVLDEGPALPTPTPETLRGHINDLRWIEVVFPRGPSGAGWTRRGSLPPTPASRRPSVPAQRASPVPRGGRRGTAEG